MSPWDALSTTDVLLDVVGVANHSQVQHQAGSSGRQQAHSGQIKGKQRKGQPSHSHAIPRLDEHEGSTRSPFLAWQGGPWAGHRAGTRGPQP